MSRLTVIFYLGLLWQSLGCMGDDKDPFEKIAKLRAIGASALPAVTQPSEAGEVPRVTELTFYAAVPLGQQVSVEPFEDTAAGLQPKASVEVVPGSEQYKDYAAFRLYTVTARVIIPVKELLPIAPKPGFTRLKYGLLLRSGDEEEKVVGSLLIYPKGASELSWQLPTVAITAPTENPQVEAGSIELKAESISPNSGENLRIGWYVSAGKVLNRRAKETKWQEATSGVQTIIVTARGLKSGAFAIPKVLDVTVP